MINILVRDYYKFYQQGIEALLSFLFLSEYRESVDFYYDLTPSNITRADIIVIDLCAGEQLTCLSELKTAGHALIIGIVDSEFSSRTLLPGCLSHSVIIARSESLAFCFAKIKFAVSKKMSFPELPVLNGFATSWRRCLVLSNSAISSRAESPNMLPPMTTGSLLWCAPGFNA